MIKFSPVNYDKLPEPYCLDSSLNGYIGYDMSNSEQECGFSVFRVNGYTMEIVEIVTDADDETVEGFIRSSLNYGANRGAYIAYFKASSGKNVAENLGFKNNGDNVPEGEIPELLAGHCCKNK